MEYFIINFYNSWIQVSDECNRYIFIQSFNIKVLDSLSTLNNFIEYWL